MTARNWGGTFSQIAILNPFRFPVTAWALISHKLMRWLSPFFLVVLFAASLLSALYSQWTWLFWLQAVFYASALFGWQMLAPRKRRGRVWISVCILSRQRRVFPRPSQGHSKPANRGVLIGRKTILETSGETEL